MDYLKTYVFQLMGTNEIYEVQAEDSAEAFKRCLKDKHWAVEWIVFLGQKEDKN